MEYQPPLAISCTYCCLMSIYRLPTVQKSSAQRSTSQAPCIPMFLHLQPVHVFFMTPVFLWGLSISAHTESHVWVHHTAPHLSLAPGMEELHSQCLMDETLGRFCTLTHGQISQQSLPKADLPCAGLHCWHSWFGLPEQEISSRWYLAAFWPSSFTMGGKMQLLSWKKRDAMWEFLRHTFAEN